MPVEPSNTEREWTPSTEQVRSHYVFNQQDQWDAERGAAFDRWLAEIRAADAEEIAGYVALTDRQSDLLRSTVAVLRGAPPALTMWSHHDIPELAAKLVAERDALAQQIAAVRALADEHWDWKAGLILAGRLRAILANGACLWRYDDDSEEYQPHEFSDDNGNCCNCHASPVTPESETNR